MSHHDAVAVVEDALVKALFSDTARHQLHDGDALGLPADLARDLRAPERCDVDALSGEIRSRLPKRANRGVGTLRDAFPRTLAAWSGEADALFAAFADSSPFCRWKPVAFCGLGPSLEECFATWAQEQTWSDADVVDHEMYRAVCRALATDPDPAFTPPSAFVGSPGHWVAVRERATPILYAAIHGRVVTGPVTPLIAGVLRGEDDARLAERFSISLDSVQQTRRAVARKGLHQGGARTPTGD